MPQPENYAAERYRQRKMSIPFLDQDPMEGPPRFRGHDLKNPRLRRCTFDPRTIVFESRLGGGSHGYVWKVRFGEQGTFALKVFWDQTPPREAGSYYPMQRECQNAAVLQMMEAAIVSEPVLVYNCPEGKEDAMENYYAFSEEFCAKRYKWDPTKTIPPPGTTFISSMPRMVKCYGWLKIPGDLWQDLPADLQATHEDMNKVRGIVNRPMDCIGVVYELIEDGENSACAVEEVDEFLWYAGFAYTVQPKPKDWKSGVLVGHSEFVHTRGYGWNEEDYMEKSAEHISDGIQVDGVQPSSS